MTVELEAERKNRQTKQNALQLTTEEISRANSIISIQVKELSQLKKKVEMRTDIALQQEKAVKMLEQENETLRLKLKEVFMNSDNQKDISKRLEELRIGTDELEQKYSKSMYYSLIRRKYIEYMTAPTYICIAYLITNTKHTE